MPGPLPQPIEDARIEWSRDGVEYHDLEVDGWTGKFVRVHIADPRRTPRTLWLSAEDVERL